VKATNGPRYVVGCRRQLDKTKLKAGTRVALDMTTLTIMRYLPREVDPLVYNMSHEDPGNVSYGEVGGLQEQIRELREACAHDLDPSLSDQRCWLKSLKSLKGCRVTNHQSGTFSSSRYNATKRLSTIWSAGNR
jgi:hypothetical protein